MATICIKTSRRVAPESEPVDNYDASRFVERFLSPTSPSIIPF